MTLSGRIVRMAAPALVVGMLMTGCATQPGTDASPVPGTQSDPVADGGADDGLVDGGADDGVVDDGLVDDGLFVAAEALGPGWSHRPERLGVPRWPWVQDDCPAYRDVDYPAHHHRLGAEQRRYYHPSSTGLALGVVEVYEPTWAQHAMADARKVVQTCPTYRFGTASISFELLDPGPDRPDRLLVRGRIEYPQSTTTVSYFLSVRRGETVATLSLPDPGSPTAAQQTLHQMAEALTRTG
ncbi:hypothetical protein [Micromonospora sp. NBC_01813]|uniref:hypothetical protein n=1 Tax=Micromonospora sp. NBC_01813 TaxID=2975988 RepID=UPI002DDB1C5B|nr:hypothetical protein [Micromonospora sp. NBC_01813]WSA07484.1 hypothetical protein OG958_25030 [Micromonospora sp. NBC_01813]